jgi:hypothetical protein
VGWAGVRAGQCGGAGGRRQLCPGTARAIETLDAKPPPPGKGAGRRTAMSTGKVPDCMPYCNARLVLDRPKT